jgi:hypothetical protein
MASLMLIYEWEDNICIITSHGDLKLVCESRN